MFGAYNYNQSVESSQCLDRRTLIDCLVAKLAQHKHTVPPRGRLGRGLLISISLIAWCRFSFRSPLYHLVPTIPHNIFDSIASFCCFSRPRTQTTAHLKQTVNPTQKGGLLRTDSKVEKGGQEWKPVEPTCPQRQSGLMATLKGQQRLHRSTVARQRLDQLQLATHAIRLRSMAGIERRGNTSSASS